MSTFNGIIAEFPSIRIDYFRKVPDKPAPLICFLSHVHSDHLQGLESLRSPFIYCSAVTRELLLRLEKYPHRMNFSKGILEARKQHYGHLAKILRPIPLNTPTEIELTPLQRIRVTLLDANHCAGAVMFLIEGQGKAILYTGDIRAESWWVNSLTRHPALVPYACGLKTLDNIYLDTTFATKSNIFRHFPSKAEGLKELLENVGRYPKDTIFYLRAWTFGYEEVWQALSTFLDSKVHVDRYQYGLYRSLASSGNGAPGFDTATFLCGFRLGNEFVPGCLTSDDSVRIHSCEPGVFCQTMKSKKSVYITPIVTRNNKTGVEVPEIGAGGGKGDLYQIHELELPDEVTVRKLEQLLSEHIEDESVLLQTKELLKLAFTSKHRALSLDEFGLADDADISFKDLALMLSSARDTRKSGSFEEKYLDMTTITFPYSRHSSYAELCELVQAFKPKDVFPCTVDEKNWNESVAMEGLFGHLCSGKKFAHDRHMRGARGEEMLEHEAKRVRYTIMSEARLQLQAMGDKVKFDIGPLPRDANEVLGEDSQSSYQTTNAHSTSEEFTREDSEETSTVGSVIHTNVEEQTEAGHTAAEAESESQQTISDLLGESQETGSEAYQNRVRAYRAALDGTFDAWNEISLVSAGDNHAEEEVEL